MSTYWYFECVDHDPPLRSVEEFTQHTDDDHYWRAVRLIHSRPVRADSPESDDMAGYFDRNARGFLAHHPHCQIHAVGEYGERRVLSIGGTNTAKAVAIEREAAAGFLDAIASVEMWADIATRYRLAAQSIRNGEHVKEEA